MNFSEYLKSGSYIILDGAMGTMLQREGLTLGQNPSLLSVLKPELIEKIHRAYLENGSNVVYSNSFTASELKLAGSGYTVEEIITAAVTNAKRAAASFPGTFVALDLGPLGELVEPLGTLGFERAVELYARQIRAGAAAGCDLVAIETMMDIYELKAAVLAAKENCRLPVIATMTFEASGRTFTGCDIPTMALTLEGLGVDAIGINCSLGPKELAPMIGELSDWTSLPIIAKPNAGLPTREGGYSVGAAEFCESMKETAAMGARILGGCCGSDPSFIRALAEEFLPLTPAKRTVRIPAAVCGPTGAVVIDRPRIVGERLNPTGKKKLKTALLESDMGYVLAQAASQIEAGAEILDVNVGVPGIDEPAVMAKVVKAVQAVTSVPLQLDSANPEALEAGLRVYNGKPIINSVNGKEESLAAVLPLAKKYGAMLIGLTLDDDGIPESVQKRLDIAKKIKDRAESAGIPPDNLCIDCLTMTIGAGADNAMITAETVRRVTKELGLKTALGVSNVSFGLPRRDIINRTFLAMALYAGLKLAIINPGDAGMVETMSAYSLLGGYDEGGERYIEAFSEPDEDPKASGQPSGTADIQTAILKGLEEQAAAACRTLLESEAPASVIQNRLIPALDEVGLRYETQRIFLPQLIRSSQAAKAAFDVVREALAKQKVAQEEKGAVVVATVMGDIHDIGKNIVRAVLENYGYHIVDLGRDVAPEEVLRAVQSSGARMAGLSALMTTTLPSMQKTISLLRERCPDCKICVGGAVLTESYAKEIGAHYYCKDASATVATAREVFGR